MGRLVAQTRPVRGRAPKRGVELHAPLRRRVWPAAMQHAAVVQRGLSSVQQAARGRVRGGRDVPGPLLVEGVVRSEALAAEQEARRAHLASHVLQRHRRAEEDPLLVPQRIGVQRLRRGAGRRDERRELPQLRLSPGGVQQRRRHGRRRQQLAEPGGDRRRHPQPQVPACGGGRGTGRCREHRRERPSPGLACTRRLELRQHLCTQRRGGRRAKRRADAHHAVVAERGGGGSRSGPPHERSGTAQCRLLLPRAGSQALLVVLLLDVLDHPRRLVER
mmetsp:Transcript_6342/g.20312  ORF Transcript_6342/g.20312 Transcript_6342/m.20312 type:complete len:276 (-) Transcript_6342:108-935(-)